MSDKIDKENILPGFFLCGAGLNFGQVDAFLLKDRQDIVQGPHSILDGKENGGLVFAGSRRRMAPMIRKRV